MKIAVIPGSYDPVTKGHVDIIRRAAGMFDRVVAAVMVNGDKGSGMFSPQERLEILKCAVRGIDGAEAVMFEGLTSELTEKTGAGYLVKGVRSASDFDYEYSLAQIMKRFSPSVETVLIPADPALAYISSSYARERLRYGCELSDVADPETARLMRELADKHIKANAENSKY